ncbi:hypothetical protein [Leptospira sarikeiensis]|uniref:Uncharacterized protein n=1 Tax=Leptospira sarikeiensis TaxID=2484943 RepID=A0A4R9K4V2_9LEPT|nr:hypothetical protein [Leptospira sarikeiensis]TGL61182.1 hypothetical protein EHQ64_11240 [Leptospira sarikeiensis]
MLEELSKELKASLYARLSDPFLKAFTGSWIIWNWQPISIALLEDQSVTWRISYIISTYFPNCHARVLGTGIPVLTALLYTFVYPFAKFGIIKFTAWINGLMREAKEKYEGSYRLTAEQSQNIRRKYELELEQVRLVNQEEINVHQELSNELILYYRKANGFENNGSADIRQCSRQLSVGIWVSDSGRTHAEPVSNRALGTLGVVIKIIGQRYCITQNSGIVRDVFHDLIPNAAYYLDYTNPGHITNNLPRNESIKVGTALNETTLEIKLEHYAPNPV